MLHIYRIVDLPYQSQIVPFAAILADIGDAWETVAMIIRMTGGNFRLLNRLLTQIERVLEINALREVTKAAVEAACQSLVSARPKVARRRGGGPTFV